MQTVWRRAYQRTTRMLRTPERPRHPSTYTPGPDRHRVPVRQRRVRPVGHLFIAAHADQNERDYQEIVTAIQYRMAESGEAA